MRQRFLHISRTRRSAVYLAGGLVCCCNGYAVLLLLLRWDEAALWRGLQLAIVLAQGYLAFTLALARHASSASGVESVGILGPIATHSPGLGFLLSELLHLLLHVTLSWFPMEAVAPGTCHSPRTNILMQQAVMSGITAILDIPAKQSMQSMLLVPMYCFLDWRYASLNGIPGSATLLQYLRRRGALMLLSRLFFLGLPALIMMRSNTAQQLAVYGLCLPLLAVQCFASGMRLFHGIDNVGMWEVWTATVVAFGIGTDVGHVVEELRAQFSKVRMIADDILPHHVVGTLMQQHQTEPKDHAEPPEQHQQQQQQLKEQLSAGVQDALTSTTGLRPLVRTSSASTVSLAAALPQLRLAVSMSYNSAASPEAKQQLFPSSSHPAAGSGGGSASRKPSSHSAELPLAPLNVRRPPVRRSSALIALDEAEYAEEHPEACILFADVCGFTTISEGTSPALIVNMLNRLFSKFDEIISESRFLYKLDVIGDCYMVASGLHWHGEDPCPARSITDFAKLMLKTAATVLDPVTQRPLSMRCGIHKGPVVGALLGTVRRKYSLFGDVVNAASRLESTSRPGAIHVSAAIYHELWLPFLCLDEQQLQQGDQELRCVDEDGEPGLEAVRRTPTRRLTGGGTSGTKMPAAPESSRPTPRSSAANSSSTWGSLRMRVTAAAEEPEGRSLAGMGLLAIGLPAGEEAAGQLDAPAAHALAPAAAKAGDGAGRADQDRLTSDQSGRVAERPSGFHSLETVLTGIGSARSAMEQQQQRSPLALAAAGASDPGCLGGVCDPTGQELWMYRGRIDLKGRAALEAYILQVI